MKHMKRYWFIVIGLAALLGMVLGATSVASADPEPGLRIQVPVLDNTTCETWVTIQNVGHTFSKAVMVSWGNPGPCQPQALGPNKVECTGLLKPGSAWVFTKDQLPSGAKSGIVYSFDATTDSNNNGVADADEACEAFFATAFNYKNWRNLDAFYRKGVTFIPSGVFAGNGIPISGGVAAAGSPLAVEVDRKCPGDVTPGFNANAAYTGISDLMEGVYDPVYGGFAYYVPLIWNQGQGGYNTTIWIQNSGDECTSIEIYFQQQDQCLHPIIGEILFLSPGETRAFNPGTIVNTPWQGSAWIRASQPLGIVVDVKGKDMFGSYRGFPSQLQYTFNGTPFYTPGSSVNYAPLIYREFNGWQTGIQVQNLSSIVNAKVKVYFVDHVGGIITTVVDWICPRGSQTFFLPVINGLPGNYVGAARVESQNWWTPGDPSVKAPDVMSVVNVIKYADQNSTTTPLEMVMYNAVQEWESFDWQVGVAGGIRGVGMLGVPLVAKAKFNQVYSELAIQNINPNPGFTDFAIYFYDQNGLLDFVCEKLNEKQVEYIDLNSWGYIPHGFLGSVIINATYTSQSGGFGLGGIAIERIGRALTDPQINGDESKGYEMFPVLFPQAINFDFEGEASYFDPVVCPGQPACSVVVIGVVKDAAGVPVATGTVTALLVGQAPPGNNPPVELPIGTFTIDAASTQQLGAGVYVLTVPGNFYVRFKFESGGATLFSPVWTLPCDGIPVTVNATLPTTLATVAATVLCDGTGKAEQGVRVRVSSDAGDAANTILKSGLTNASGVATISGLPVGSLFVWLDTDDDGVYNDEASYGLSTTTKANTTNSLAFDACNN
ncbi:MAG: hypothetical protein EXR62_02215 [Chloroflexi bacterium]|nr:hypothetical protein [Chloroflexota bacterium]